jgi:hypothetical protein
MPRIFRSALLTLALGASALALVPATPASGAVCTNGTNRWVYNGCCINATRYKGQSCIYGSWVDNGAVKCSGVCMM